MPDKVKFHLKNVTYKNVLSIEQLDIPAQRLTCIIGESGSGKTTLLRLLNHLTSPDSGLIELDGRNLLDWDPVQIRRNVVMLSQAPVMFQGTVRDNLLIGLRFSDKPAVPDETLTQLLETLHLHLSLNEDSASLSGGERQRVGLARILLLDPSVLLLDEPSSALDEETARRVMIQLTDYCHKRAKTIVMVTHSSDLVENFAENIIRIEKGRLAEEAESDARQ
ncbi:ABC transporter ATP-binding protein [Sporolactobacillus vineae]|uniref:ABC transporter ATP-binding protein n=1 Tax=Sporolactobacillus vineae TaxID=444463 RepID=UPI000525DB23|nr:ATP-binding cassette domain-containing protein [Sporolactobacillus vineae]